MTLSNGESGVALAPMALNQQQVLAIVTPVLVGVAGYLVHTLSAGVVAEVGTVLGIIVPVLVAIKNVWVSSPTQEKRLASMRSPPLSVMAMMGALLVCLFLFCFAGLVSACTATSQAMVLTAEQDACALAELVSSTIPIGTDPATVEADIKLGCGLADTATGYVEQLIQAWGTQTPPPPAGAIYHPGVRASALRRVK